MFKKINELKRKITTLQGRLVVLENEQARGEITSRIDYLQTQLATWQKFTKGERR